MMWIDAILAYLHYLAIIGVGAHLALELAFLRRELRAEVLLRLPRVDIAYFAAALAALVTGALRLAYGAKGFAFYSANPVLYAKLGVFLAVGLISISPTMTFLRWTKQSKLNSGYLPPQGEVLRVRRLVTIELLLFALLPLLGTMLARGIGH